MVPHSGLKGRVTGPSLIWPDAKAAGRWFLGYAPSWPGRTAGEASDPATAADYVLCPQGVTEIRPLAQQQDQETRRPRCTARLKY